MASSDKARKRNMLVLTRRIGDRITIGDNITVEVLGFNGSQVRLGIAAPRNVPVHREEIYKAILGEKNGNL